MAYRILVDENIDPRTAAVLRDQGHDAVHVEETLGKGAEDSSIAAYTREHDLLLLTNDADFLRPERRPALTLLYVPENTMRAHEIAELVDDLAALVPDSADLPSVTWITGP